MSAKTSSYIIGFTLSVILTLLTYVLVVRSLLPASSLFYAIAALAVIQLIIQFIFFLHIGQESGTRWKLITLLLAAVIIGIIVIGSIWIMKNLDYNMLRMTPEEQNLYLHNHEGI